MIFLDRFTYFKLGMLLRQPLHVLDAKLEECGGNTVVAATCVCLDVICSESMSVPTFFVCLHYAACRCGLEHAFGEAFRRHFRGSRHGWISKHLEEKTASSQPPLFFLTRHRDLEMERALLFLAEDQGHHLGNIIRSLIFDSLAQIASAHSTYDGRLIAFRAFVALARRDGHIRAMCAILAALRRGGAVRDAEAVMEDIVRRHDQSLKYLVKEVEQELGRDSMEPGNVCPMLSNEDEEAGALSISHPLPSSPTVPAD